MADVYTVTFILIGILLSLPALLIGLNILMPRVTERVQTRLTETPGKSFALGLGLTAVSALFILITAQANLGPLRAAAIMAGVTYAGLGTIGAAGMTRLLGQRLSNGNQSTTDLTRLLRGALIYELACFFPIVGWFLFAPLAGMTVIGAATFALLKRRPRPVNSHPSTVSSHPSTVSGNQSAAITIEAADIH